MNNIAIETFSISALNTSIAQSEVLSPFATSNDKGPSWDGYVIVYKSNTQTKDNIKGKMSIQVKGTENANFSNETINYSVDVVDLNNYLDAGVIYFVVYIKDNGASSKIYYLEMTPFKIKNWLQNVGNHKHKTLTFKEFPNDNDQKASIFMNCLNNCNKQTSFARSELYSIEELERKGVLENITFSISGYGISNKDPIGLLFSNEVYLYANTVGSSISQPLEFLDGELFVSTVRDSNISVAGKQFYDSLKVIRSKNEVTIKIGESYQMIYDDKTKQMTCKYISSDKLRTREKDLEFQLAFLENEGFYFDDILFEIKREDMNLSNFDIQQQTDMLEDVKKIVTLLDLLNADDLIISNLTQQEIRDLQSLVKGIVDNEIVGGLKQDLPTAFHISIQNYNFVLLCELVNKENASYRIYDFFKKNIVIKVQDRCCREQPISQYAFLHNTDYHIITNLELDGLVKSYKNIPENSTNYEYANFAVLDLLNSYDKTNESKYLLAAKELSQWILESELSSLPYVLRYINYVQTIKRERVLNREEVKELHRLIETTEEQPLIALNILLDRFENARDALESLNENIRKEFESWPIFKLLQ